jgi:alkyl hydroperoxide reductase subunit F
MVYDLIIIGGGPAGTGAAVYAARKKLETLMIASEFGGQSTVSQEIYNWIGTISISGLNLADSFKKHVLANVGENLKIKEGEKVITIKKVQNETSEKNIFSVKTESGEEFLTQTVLITTGSIRRKLKVLSADRLEHKGLTYCATCDGPIFAGMDVAVVGGGNAGFETAAQLLAYCKSVTLFQQNGSFNADPVTVEKVLENEKMKAVKNTEILEIKGEKFVEGLIYQIKGEKKKELKVSGIFVEIGQIPNTDFVKDLVPLDKFGQVKIGPRTQKTEVPGIWAAGDCTDALYHQNNIAAGDAIRALEDIYLELKTK